MNCVSSVGEHDETIGVALKGTEADSRVGADYHFRAGLPEEGEVSYDGLAGVPGQK
jgi:hypothetical protein